MIGHAKICSPSKVGRCAEISSPSKFRNPHWKWLVPVLHPTEMPNEDQFLESTLFIQVSLKTCNCLSTSEFPPGTLLFHNCQLPPAGSAPYCHRDGQIIYKFLPFFKTKTFNSETKWVFATVEGIFPFHPHPPGWHQRSPPDPQFLLYPLYMVAFANKRNLTTHS